jgi:hypothetical protein
MSPVVAVGWKRIEPNLDWHRGIIAPARSYWRKSEEIVPRDVAKLVYRHALPVLAVVPAAGAPQGEPALRVGLHFADADIFCVVHTWTAADPGPDPKADRPGDGLTRLRIQGLGLNGPGTTHRWQEEEEEAPQPSARPILAKSPLLSSRGRS